MKKQIAILATILVTAGFSAFGQGYVNVNIANGWIYDEFTTPGVGAKAADIDIAFLWAASGTADTLTSYGSQFQTNSLGINGVASNGVSSVSSPLSTVSTMIGSGWNWVTNDYSGTAGFGNLVTVTTGTKGGAAYTQGFNSTTIQVLGSSLGQTIELIAIAWNASAGANGYSTATDYGWSNPFNYVTGASSSDTAGTVVMSSENLTPFGVAGVASVPEPTTLALAGLGGLSMLFLRRRKA